MKINISRKAPKYDKAREALVWATNDKTPYLIDKKLQKKVGQIKWSDVPKFRMARGTPKEGQLRVQLHRFVCKLLGHDWEKIVFKNGDRHDLRSCNLRPYDYEEDGRARAFKKRKLPRLVYFNKHTKRFYVNISVKGKIKYVGSAKTVEEAAKIALPYYKMSKAKKFFGETKSKRR